MNIRVNRNSIIGVILTGETALLRIWFSLWSFSWTFLSFVDGNFATTHDFVAKIAPIPVLAFLFFVHAFSLLYGVITRRYSTTLLFLEGILGVFLWAGVGIAESLQYKTISPSVLAGFTALFLLIRYPTHYSDPREDRE